MATLLDVQSAFDEAGHGHEIKANFIHNTNILIDNVRRPSEADFRPQIKQKMSEFLHSLQQQNAPFLIDMFPIQDVHNNTFLDPSFGFPDILIKDINGAVYTNVFEWQYDCFAWALHKLNASTVKIVVNQVGWPTDGFDGANAANAERFFKHLLPLVASNKGTPMRPGAPIDIFINSLTDEPKMFVTQPFTRHWGVYRSNGEPKYKIDLSGQGRDIFPTTVRGIMRMPHRWCVFNGNDTDLEKVRNQSEVACKQGDCTTLSPLASCSNLSFDKNVSYAFNSFFQTFFQDEAACDFGGLAYVSDEDPSTEECVFPVEVVKGRQIMESKWAAAQHVTPPNSAALFIFMLSIFHFYVFHNTGFRL
ncbi:hypothetical protein C2S51_002341 [Perilla frutescens var. frutescens]|nr:hypothetical protein C2S51_002341 [Perilla frutescens var. frutescens]